MYVAALRDMIKAKTEENETLSINDLSFNPPDLIEFMVRRAKMEPLAF